MRLKEIREARGITQRQAAIDLNMSPTVYNRYEKGLREPSNVVLIAIANYFGVSVDELLGRESVSEQDIIDAEAVIRERLRRDPSYHLLFEAANKATPEALKAAAAVLKALESKEDE